MPKFFGPIFMVFASVLITMVCMGASAKVVGQASVPTNVEDIRVNITMVVAIMGSIMGVGAWQEKRITKSISPLSYIVEQMAKKVNDMDSKIIHIEARLEVLDALRDEERN